MIVDVSVMPANRHDQDGAMAAVDRAMAHTGRIPEAVCADAAYANGPNAAAMEECGVRLVSPPPAAAKSPKLPRNQFTIEDFAYDDQKDIFICPAGETLRYAGTESSGRCRRRYRAPKSSCKQCPLKVRCTISKRKQINVSADHASLVRLRADRQTASFKALYRTRAPVIEGVFAEAKQWHGLGRAWRRGLAKMRVQCLLTAAVINFKRLATVFRRLFGVKGCLHAILTAISRLRCIIRHQEMMWISVSVK